MKTFLTTAFALAVLTGGALAQSVAPPLPPPGASAGQVGVHLAPIPDADAAGAPPPPAGPRGQRSPPGGPGPMDEAGPGGPSDGPRGHRPPPPSPAKAAHFHLGRGDTALDVKCAEDEPMAGCADAVLRMLDKLQALPKQP